MNGKDLFVEQGGKPPRGRGATTCGARGGVAVRWVGSSLDAGWFEFRVISRREMTDRGSISKNCFGPNRIVIVLGVFVLLMGKCVVKE